MDACAQTNSIRESLGRLRPDVHSCLIYETPQERLSAAVPLMEGSLRRGEKCIYLCDETRGEELLNAMRERGIDTNAAIESGALTVIAAGTPSGCGATASAFDLLAEAGRAANGTPVTLAREFSCAPGQTVDQAQIEEYERQVAACFTGRKYVDVALYDRQRVPPQVLLNVIRTHPVVILDNTVCDNFYAVNGEGRLALEPTAGQEVERALANLRDRQRIENGLKEQCRGADFLPVESLLTGSAAKQPQSGCGTCLSQISTLQEQILYTEKMEALGRMAAGMVNEFRNALTTILGFSELLMDRMEPDDNRVHLVKQISAAGRNATELTNQLLAFGRPALIRSEVVDLNSAVAELEEVLRVSLTGRSELRILPAPGACPVKVDRGQLEQVLVNLVLNARDAMPQGGTVTIQTAQIFRRLDSSPQAQPVATLSVTDTGFGMDSNTQKRVFDPFFTTKGAGLGAGLGLSVVYGIVQQQFGGSLSVNSRPGQGTTVTVYLPLAEKPAD